MSEQTVKTGTWSVTTSSDDFALAGLGDEWDDLVARCSSATPFQAHAWLESWWRGYGRPGRLRLVLIRYAGRLVAAAPLTLRWRSGCPVLSPLGGAFSDFTDVLIDDDVAAEAARRLVQALIGLPGWQAIDFPETRPGAGAGTALWQAWTGPRSRTAASVCFELPASEMEPLVKELPTHSRKTVRRRLNQLRKAAVQTSEVPASDAGRGVRELLRLHDLQWQGRGVNQQHLSPAYAAHLTRSAGAMIASGQAALLEYHREGALVASSLVLISPELVGGYLYGADPALREHLDVTTLLLADTLPLAHRRGCTTMSMLRGDEPHKRVWQPAESLNQRIVLTRPNSVRGTAYAAGIRSYRRAVLAAKERAPWLRAVRDRLRASTQAWTAGRRSRR
jgi:CelD/BcsL family acetyltransferase involved in cellulose biosynthesis